MSTVTLSRRDRALLIAAAEGRCDVVPSACQTCGSTAGGSATSRGPMPWWVRACVERATVECSRPTVPPRLTDAGRAALAA